MSEALSIKFGGTSAARPEACAGIIEEYASEADQLIVTMSAIGKDEERGYGDKITDDLIAYRKDLENGRTIEADERKEMVIHRHEVAYGDLLATSDLQEMQSYIGSLLTGDIEDTHNRAYFPSLGETMSAQCMAKYLGAYYMESPIIIKSGSVDYAATKREFEKAMELASFHSAKIIILPGFYGRERRQNGLERRATLGRGGSDRTAVFPSGIMKIPYFNCTDQDGIMTADPRIWNDEKEADPNFVVPARAIGRLIRREVTEGANGGSGVLHGGTMYDLGELDPEGEVHVVVRNTFSDAPGTRVELEPDPENQSDGVVAIASKDVFTIRISDRGMNDAKGYAADITTLAGKHNISLELAPWGHNDVLFTIEDKNSDEPEDTQFSNVEAFAAAIEKSKKKAEVEAAADKAVIYLVGEALAEREVFTETLGQACLSLVNEGLYLDAAPSYPGGARIALLVDRDDRKPITKVLHRELIEKTA